MVPFLKRRDAAGRSRSRRETVLARRVERSVRALIVSRPDASRFLARNTIFRCSGTRTRKRILFHRDYHENIPVALRSFENARRAMTFRKFRDWHWSRFVIWRSRGASVVWGVYDLPKLFSKVLRGFSIKWWSMRRVKIMTVFVQTSQLSDAKELVGKAHASIRFNLRNWHNRWLFSLFGNLFELLILCSRKLMPTTHFFYQ